MSITLWESEDALNASVERANQMRQEATDQADGGKAAARVSSDESSGDTRQPDNSIRAGSLPLGAGRKAGRSGTLASALAMGAPVAGGHARIGVRHRVCIGHACVGMQV